MDSAQPDSRFLPRSLSPHEVLPARCLLTANQRALELPTDQPGSLCSISYWPSWIDQPRQHSRRGPTSMRPPCSFGVQAPLLTKRFTNHPGRIGDGGHSSVSTVSRRSITLASAADAAGEAGKARGLRKQAAW